MYIPFLHRGGKESVASNLIVVSRGYVLLRKGYDGPPPCVRKQDSEEADPDETSIRYPSHLTHT